MLTEPAVCQTYLCIAQAALVQQPPTNVRYWSNSGHCWILARDGLSAFDPKRTCDSDQSMSESRRDADGLVDVRERT